jgi:hypothetical protein
MRLQLSTYKTPQAQPSIPTPNHRISTRDRKKRSPTLLPTPAILLLLPRFAAAAIQQKNSQRNRHRSAKLRLQKNKKLEVQNLYKKIN